MNTTATRCGACSTPPGPGSRPGLIVASRNMPLLSVCTRPKPLNLSSSGFSCASSGCEYLPCALACHVSTIASLTGLPSASSTRPRIVTRSPPTPGDATSAICVCSKLIAPNGPNVCDAVNNRLMSLLHGRGVAAAQDNVEPVRNRMVGHRMFPVELADQALACALVGHARIHRVVSQQRVTRKIHLRNEPLDERPAEQ